MVLEKEGGDPFGGFSCACIPSKNRSNSYALYHIHAQDTQFHCT